MVTNYIAGMLTCIIGHDQLWINPLLHQIASYYFSPYLLKEKEDISDWSSPITDLLNIAIQPAFLVKRSSNLELLHRNTWKILTRKAVSFGLFIFH